MILEPEIAQGAVISQYVVLQSFDLRLVLEMHVSFDEPLVQFDDLAQ